MERLRRLLTGDCRRVRACTFAGVLLLFVLPCTSQQPSSSTPPASSASTVHAPPAAGDLAGDAACASCHRKEAETYLRSPHHLDSAPATAGTILGNFTPGDNIVRSRDPSLIFAMIAAPDGFYQSAVRLEDPDHPHGIAQRFDVVVGSGRRGQTYLFWSGDLLFELPISFWTSTREWINSPGYPDGQVHFDRPIIPRCLECHTTWFRALPANAASPRSLGDAASGSSLPASAATGENNRFDPGSLVLGIGCEKCHGPGRLHVERERSPHPPPLGSREEAIVNPARLPHDRQLDLCALCHAGVGLSLQPPLSYRPGDLLAAYLLIDPPPPGTPVDVHGDQVAALERSRCFTSGALTCSTCHNVHAKQEDVDAFSVHCLSCHKAEACGRYKHLGEVIRTRCVECHMPEGKSSDLHSSTGGRFLQAQLRTHQIGIYPGATLLHPGVRGTAR